MSKRFVDPKTGTHIKNKQSANKIMGTIRYISANANQGFEHSRRDDLESVVLMCI